MFVIVKCKNEDGNCHYEAVDPKKRYVYFQLPKRVANWAVGNKFELEFQKKEDADVVMNALFVKSLDERALLSSGGILMNVPCGMVQTEINGFTVISFSLWTGKRSRKKALV